MKSLVGLVWLFAAIPAAASGLSKPVLIGPSAIGMGGAFVALADDPTAIFHNPAGLSQVAGQRVLVAFDVLIPGLEYTFPGAGGEHSNSEVLPVFAALYSTDAKAPAVLGLGLYFPHGNGGRFNQPSANPLNPNKGLIYTMELAPAAAWKPRSDFALGGALRVVRISTSLEGQYDPSSATTIEDLGLTGWGLGATVGALWKPCGAVSAGATYRSRVRTNLEGDITLASSGSSATYDASIRQTIPALASAGIAYRLRLVTAALSYDYEWNSSVTPYTLKVSKVGTLPSRGEWSDSRTLHIGLRYHKSPTVSFQAGYAKDLDDSIPDEAMNRVVGDIAAHEVALGSTCVRGRYTIGLAWNARFDQRDIAMTATNPAPGHYDGFVQLISIALGFTL